MFRVLAAWMRLAATSRTWLTPPAEPSISGLARVCTESTINSSGFKSLTCASAAERSVSAVRYSFSERASMRSARSLTCAADSSPVTYNTVRGSGPPATLAAASRSSVDLPTPGSPAIRMTAPGTSPPPRTRSNSVTRVGVKRATEESTWPMG